MANLATQYGLPSIPTTNWPQIPGQPAGPRPSYFISRSNGLLVPLIAADELPFNIRLEGVTRVLRLDQTHGMQHVGTAPYSGLTYKLEQDTALFRSSSQPASASHSRNISATSTNGADFLTRRAFTQSTEGKRGSAALPPRPLSAHETASTWRKAPTSDPTDKTQSVIDAIVGSSPSAAEEAARLGYFPKSSTTPASGKEPDQDKKEYCTHWIRHGECDYTQQSCLYKHEMPDRATLEKIGFRSLPRWWVERTSPLRLVGGESARLGPTVKPAVWLKGKGQSEEAPVDVDDESSDSTSGDDRVSTNSSTAKPEPKPEHATAAATKVDAVAKHSANNQKSPAAIDIRKASANSDLIDFAPLLPTPPSSTASLSAIRSADYSPRSGQTTPLTPPLTPKPQKQTAKIFVPAGESIAEAKKRHARRAAPASSIRSAAPVGKQIQDLQKAKHQQGLMASKHAPARVDGAHATQRNGKAACRIRRAVVAAPVSAVQRVSPISSKESKESN